jgi:DNA polymerase III subunit beta
LEEYGKEVHPLEFFVQRSDLVNELELVLEAVERKASVPVPSHVLVEAAQFALRITTTDLELGVRSKCVAKVRSDGACVLPAHRLQEIARSLPEADIHFKSLENAYVQLSCARSTFKLAGMPKDRFPELPIIPKPQANLPSGTLNGLIERTRFATSNAEGRSTLNAALLVLKPDPIGMVATDGTRLALAERAAKLPELDKDTRLLIPKKAMLGLHRLVSSAGEGANVEIAQEERHLFFSAGERVVIARKLAGDYPDYEAVLPRDNGRVIEVAKDGFRAALRRVSLLAKEEHRAVRVGLDAGRLELSCSGGEYGEAVETMDIQYRGEPLQITFNQHFLDDFLGSIREAEDVRLELKDSQSATELRPAADNGYLHRYILMPLRS